MNYVLDGYADREYTKKREKDLHTFPRSELEMRKQTKHEGGFLDKVNKMTLVLKFMFTWF